MDSSGRSPETEIPSAASTSDPARLDRLEHQVAELSGRLAALEHKPAAAAAAGPGAGQAAAPAAQGPGGAAPAEEQTLTYGGNVRLGGSRMVVGFRRTVDNVLDTDPDAPGRVFTALASPARITLLQALLNGPRTSQQLRGVLDDPSAGQLYHHLRELLAAGLVVQPGRSVYSLPRGSEVDLCVLVLAAANLASGARSSPPPDAEQNANSGEPPAPG